MVLLYIMLTMCIRFLMKTFSIAKRKDLLNSSFYVQSVSNGKYLLTCQTIYRILQEKYFDRPRSRNCTHFEQLIQLLFCVFNVNIPFQNHRKFGRNSRYLLVIAKPNSKFLVNCSLEVQPCINHT